MMPSADQHRWFTHHTGIPATSHHPDVTGLTAGAASFAPGGPPRAHHPAINPYMEASYIDDIHHHMEGQRPTGYYSLNVQYRAAHQRSISGKRVNFTLHFFWELLFTKNVTIGWGESLNSQNIYQNLYNLINFWSFV